MPAQYSRHGLEFLYPENWTLVDDDANTIPRTVSIQAPSGAFWSLDIHPFGVRPADVADEFLRTLQAEYEDLEFEAIQETIAGEAAVGYDVHFYCLDFVVTAAVRGFRHGHATYVLTYQAEDREFDRLHPVFLAVTESMLRSMAESSDTPGR